ncbi:TetR/AcrR family transcriptional regulator [Microbacterium sp. Mu-80]|uniref:TetR/AcrR family transcriptional regulator n=1 Tax=Microbacterium bandirmense TaxID=3122050 RepID=A0ABU8LB41_9MICO
MAPTVRGDRNEHSDRRDQILTIAAHLIAKQGYSGTTVRDIADEAGILSGSLYHHFPSKEAILQEILRGFLERLLERFEGIVAEGRSPRETVDSLVQHAFVIITSQPDAVGLYQNELSFLTGQAGFEFLGEKRELIEALWIDQLREGQKVGDFRESLDVAVAYRFLRDAMWSTVGWYRPGRGHSVESLTATFLDLLHHGLLAD